VRALGDALKKDPVLGGARRGGARAGADPARRRAGICCWPTVPRRARARAPRRRRRAGASTAATEARGDRAGGPAAGRRSQLLRRGRGGAEAWGARGRRARSKSCPSSWHARRSRTSSARARSTGWARRATSARFPIVKGEWKPGGSFLARRAGRDGDRRAGRGHAARAPGARVHRRLLARPRLSRARRGGVIAGPHRLARGGCRRYRARAGRRARRPRARRRMAEAIRELARERPARRAGQEAARTRVDRLRAEDRQAARAHRPPRGAQTAASPNNPAPIPAATQRQQRQAHHEDPAPTARREKKSRTPRTARSGGRARSFAPVPWQGGATPPRCPDLAARPRSRRRFCRARSF